MKGVKYRSDYFHTNLTDMKVRLASLISNVYCRSNLMKFQEYIINLVRLQCEKFGCHILINKKNILIISMIFV